MYLHLIALAWMLTVTLAAIAEIISPQGSVWGGLGTWVGYGLLPLALVLYIFGTPLRRRHTTITTVGDSPAAKSAPLADPSPDLDDTKRIVDQ